MDRKTIFISHANPEDNYFSAWLAAKLKVLGYNVWLDLDDINLGDYFVSKIDPVIQKESILFIMIVTESYTQKYKDQFSGISKEVNSALTLEKSNLLNHNFIIPVRATNIPFDHFPYDIRRWKAVDFSEDWQGGLIELVKELEKLKVPKNEALNDPLALWFSAIKAEKTVIHSPETYYSNWFPLTLPEKIYIHKPTLFSKEKIYDLPYPLITEANHIITFCSKITTKRFIELDDSWSYETTDFVNNFDLKIHENFLLIDPSKKFVRLLNKSFQDHLRKSGLTFWKKKNRKVYYFRHDLTSSSINLKRFGKPKGRRSLVGKVTESIRRKKTTVNWAFSLSPQAHLEPTPHFRMIYSLAMTNKKYWRFDKEAQHKLRRSIPSGWFNRRWFETLLAAMLEISPDHESKFVLIEIDDNQFLKVSNIPFMGVSPVGYIEP